MLYIYFKIIATSIRWLIWPLIGPPLFGYLLFQPFNQVVVKKQKLFGNAGQKRLMLKTHM